MQTPVRKVQVNAPLNIPRTTAAHTGGQEAAALGNLGGAVGSVASDIDKIQKQNDTFKAQKGYNQISDLAFNGEVSGTKKVPGYNEYLNRKGENATGSAQAYSNFLDAQKQKILEGLTPRQQRMLLQNWEPKAAALKQRVAQHEVQQIEVAQINEMGVLIESQAQEIVNSTGVDVTSKAWGQLETVFRTLQKRQGVKAEAIDANWEKTKESVVTRQFDTLLKAEEFDSAEMLIGIEAGAEATPKQEVMLQLVKDARVRKEVKAAQAAERAVNLGDSHIQEDVARNSGGDPLYMPPLELFEQHYGAEIGETKYLTFKAHVDKQRASQVQVDPEAYSRLIDIVKNPGKYSYEEKLTASMQAAALAEANPLYKDLDEDVSKARKEVASQGFISPATDKKANTRMKIFSLFRSAAFEGMDTFGNKRSKRKNLEMTSGGVVALTGDPAQLELSKALENYNKILERAQANNIPPWEVDKLVEDIVITPLAYWADRENMTKKDWSGVLSNMNRDIAGIGAPPAAENPGLYLPSDFTEEDQARVSELISFMKGETNAPTANP